MLGDALGWNDILGNDNNAFLNEKFFLVCMRAHVDAEKISEFIDIQYG